MLVGEDRLDGAVAHPVEVVGHGVAVTVARRVLVGVVVGVTPEFTLVVHELVTRILDAVFEVGDDLVLGRTVRQFGLAVAAGVEQEDAGLHRFSGGLGRVTGHVRSEGVDPVGHQFDGFRQVFPDKLIDLVHRGAGQVDGFRRGPQGNAAESLDQFIVGEGTEEVGLAEETVLLAFARPVLHVVHIGQRAVGPVDQGVVAVPQAEEVVEVVLVQEEVAGAVARVGQVAAEAVVAGQVGDVEEGRGLRRLIEEVGVDRRHHLLGVEFGLREGFRGPLGEVLAVEEVLATGQEHDGRQCKDDR